MNIEGDLGETDCLLCRPADRRPRAFLTTFKTAPCGAIVTVAKLPHRNVVVFAVDLDLFHAGPIGIGAGHVQQMRREKNRDLPNATHKAAKLVPLCDQCVVGPRQIALRNLSVSLPVNRDTR